ncbi:MAG: outer membrane beta-barrel protein [Rhizobiaceae bacterium]|nr:outer membrane beta-barrel protein [Rhizobiaceae bacterium]
MKYFVAGALSTILMMSPALAADMVVEDAIAAPSGANIYDWSGFHVGIGGGTSVAVHDLSTPAFGGASFNGIGGDGLFGQVSAGYDFVFDNGFLLGAEVSGRYGDVKTKASLGGLSADLTAEYGFDAVARLGYSVAPNVLGYVLGGYSWQRFDVSTSVPGISYDWDDGGYVLGVGMETALRNNLTLKTEYRYAKYNSHDVLGGGLLFVDPSTHSFLTTLNYRFNGGPSSQTMAPVNYDWTGFKVGASVGAGALVHDVDVAGGGFNFNGIGGEGIFGDINIGYDHQFNDRFVGGIQIAGRFSNMQTELNVFGGSGDITADYGIDVLARLGMLVGDRSMAYVIGGYSWQHFDLSTSPAIFSYDWDANGFTVGTGLEVAFSQKITGFTEYRYSRYESEDFGSGGFLEATPRMHTVRMGVKYKF